MWDDKLTDIPDYEEREIDMSNRLWMMDIECDFFENSDHLLYARFHDEYDQEVEYDILQDYPALPWMVDAVTHFYDHVSEQIAMKAQYGTVRMYPNGFHKWTVKVLMMGLDMWDICIFDHDMQVGLSPRFVYKSMYGIDGRSPASWRESAEARSLDEIYRPFVDAMRKEFR